MAKKIKWKLTNKQIAEIVGKKSVAQVAIWKQHGLPNSKSKKVLVAWHKGYIAQRASRTTYKLSNVEIGKLLRINKKGMLKETLANKVSRLRKLGLPDTEDFKEVTYWYENFLLTKEDKKSKRPKELAKKLGISPSKCASYLDKGMPNTYNKALPWLRIKEARVTLQQIGDALVLTKERVRQMVKLGMPFNESLTPIQDAVKWYRNRPEVKEERKKQGKFINKSGKTNKYKAEKIGISLAKLKQFEEKGMPSNNIAKSKKWLKENCVKSPKGLWKLK